MGTAMAGRLIAAGHTVVVHNRTRAHARSLEDAGAGWADTPAALARRCEVVLGCVHDTAAVEAVYLGPDGLIDAASPGQVFVEHGTFTAGLARRLGAAALARGASFVDAPVTGGPEGARTGVLAAMAGGDPIALHEVDQVLRTYCSSVTRTGDVGSGLELKLVNQLLVGVHMAVAGEAVALLERLGFDLGLARSVLTRGWAGSAMFERTLTHVATGQLTGTGATIGGMIEVQSLVADLLTEREMRAPVFAAAQSVFAAAVAAGGSADDPAALGHLRPAEESA
jgi:3-hydroxyisobutyrate dehydrogenase-like beta-hydroxyacid dehydrogenase